MRRLKPLSRVGSGTPRNGAVSQNSTNPRSCASLRPPKSRLRNPAADRPRRFLSAAFQRAASPLNSDPDSSANRQSSAYQKLASGVGTTFESRKTWPASSSGSNPDLRNFDVFPEPSPPPSRNSGKLVTVVFARRLASLGERARRLLASAS